MAGFTPEQLAQIKDVVEQAVTEAVKKEFGNAGLRLDTPADQDEARRDFMWARSFRHTMSGFASKIGWFVIAALLGTVFYIVQLGLEAWRRVSGI